MEILIVGSGGREHALAWALARSPLKPKLAAAPGNPGIGRLAELLPVSTGDVEALARLARDRRPDLVVVGPEAPLAEGLADRIRDAGIPVFGPGREGARLEASKTYAKTLLLEAGVPTAAAESFTDPAKARAYLRDRRPPYVLKADGLAAGKGVTVCASREEAEAVLARLMEAREFGEAGSRVLVEDHLEGEEASLLAFTDGETIVPMASAQDHKRALDGDEGPNTGGMGAVSPAPVVTWEAFRRIREEVLEPTLRALKRRGVDYRGVLYAGLMMTAQGPKVIEYNCRFGDPEAQAILPRLETDLAAVCLAAAQGRLSGFELSWRFGAAACVVMASKGYPGSYSTGIPLEGLEEAEAMLDCVVFHAGTALREGHLVTAGGRVLGVTGWGSDLAVALRRAYDAVRCIHFEGAHWRRDIGKRALHRAG